MRTFDTIEDLRQALLAFRETYNATWLIQRHGFMSCPRFFWTPICPTGGRYGEVQHEQDHAK